MLTGGFHAHRYPIAYSCALVGAYDILTKVSGNNLQRQIDARWDPSALFALYTPGNDGSPARHGVAAIPSLD